MTRKKANKQRESQRDDQVADATTSQSRQEASATSTQRSGHELEEVEPVLAAEVVATPSAALVRSPRRILASPIGPWSRLTRAWLRESEKLHEISIDRMGSVIDDSHRLALESVATITSIGLTYQRGVLEQLERSVELMTTFGRSAG